MRSFAALALILAVASCEKSSKDDKDKKGGEGTGTGSAEASGTGTASGTGSASGSAQAAAEKATDVAAGDEWSTGEPTCDALVAMMKCTWDKTPGVPESTKKMFQDGIVMWRQGLASDATRQTIIESCKTSLDAGRAGFDALGCKDTIGTANFGSPGMGSGGGGGSAVAVAGATPTGEPTCDELVARTMCMYTKTPGVPDEAIQAFTQSIAAWTEALHNDAVRQATIDACKMSLDAGKDGFASMGCGDHDYQAYLTADAMAKLGGGTTATPPPTTGGSGTAATGSVGDPACDELIRRTMCMYDKSPGAPDEAKKAFQDAVSAWKEALKNSATRSAVVDACKMSLDAANDGFQGDGLLMRRLALTFVLLAACGGKSGGAAAPATGGSCDEAASNIATAIPDLDDAEMSEVGNAVAQICASDAWSAAAIACFSTASSQDAMQPCNDKLTDEQQDSLGSQMAARTDTDEDPMADEPEEPPLDDSELED